MQENNKNTNEEDFICVCIALSFIIPILGFLINN